jgi:DNA-binding CsgD family transcriptional regulator
MAISPSDAIAMIEAATSVAELRAILQTVSVSYGFSSYAFVDISNAGDEQPFVVMTNRADWDETYRSNGFISVDPCLSQARRQMTPFCWSELSLPQQKGKKLPGALKTLRAAHDHGYREGIVIPFHYVDGIGRSFTSVCTFFWTDRIHEFMSIFRFNRANLHLILIYWAQRAIDLSCASRYVPARFADREGNPLCPVQLTDRERDVLSWAARGKTASETADILGIAEGTVIVHLKNVMDKLGAPSKTNAVARAIYLGLIDL